VIQVAIAGFPEGASHSANHRLMSASVKGVLDGVKLIIARVPTV
jgi:hypothetical protein